MDRLAGEEKQEGPPLPGVSNTPAGSGDGGEEAADHCLRTKLGFKKQAIRDLHLRKYSG